LAVCIVSSTADSGSIPVGVAITYLTRTLRAISLYKFEINGVRGVFASDPSKRFDGTVGCFVLNCEGIWLIEYRATGNFTLFWTFRFRYLDLYDGDFETYFSLLAYEYRSGKLIWKFGNIESMLGTIKRNEKQMIHHMPMGGGKILLLTPNMGSLVHSAGLFLWLVTQ